MEHLLVKTFLQIKIKKQERIYKRDEKALVISKNIEHKFIQQKTDGNLF